MMVASQGARRPHAPKQNHPCRNKKEARTAATSRSHPLGALDHAVRVVHGVCCLAGSASLIDDLRVELRAEGVPAAIRRHDTGTLFDWLVAAVSYQGISDRVASGYMERHGRARWRDIETKLGQGTTCPKLQSYWHYHGCRYDKISRTCAEPDHIDHCPVPSHDLRNGRLNQTSYSLYLFVRDIADGDLVGWIDRQLRGADSPHDADRPARLREALIGPLREVYGVSDKVLTMTLSCVLLTAPRGYETWRQVGATMIAIDTLVHNFLHRTGILARFGADHPYGAGCYRPGGCADIVSLAAQRIDTRAFNPAFPAIFPRFVQHAVWRYCAQLGLDVCNGNRIDDRQPCNNVYCQLRGLCDRIALHKTA
jgi:hypothetical protein